MALQGLAMVNASVISVKQALLLSAAFGYFEARKERPVTRKALDVTFIGYLCTYLKYCLDKHYNDETILANIPITRRDNGSWDPSEWKRVFDDKVDEGLMKAAPYFVFTEEGAKTGSILYKGGRPTMGVDKETEKLLKDPDFLRILNQVIKKAKNLEQYDLIQLLNEVPKDKDAI